MVTTTNRPRRRRTVGANTYDPPGASGTIALTPEQEAENAGTQALIRVFGAISDAAKVAPLDQVIGIAMEGITFVAGEHAGSQADAVRARVQEIKAELMGMLWE